MRVVFGNHFYGYLMYGGGEVQLEKTREVLVRQGIEVQLFDQWKKTSLDGADIVHWFHIDPASKEILEIAKRKGSKVVISTIFWPRRSFLSAWTKITGLPKRIGIPVTSYYAMQREVIRLADIVIVSSESEMRHIRNIFGVSPNMIRVIPVGVSLEFAGGEASEFVQRYGLKDFVLCVGRIEPRKNQYRLIKALKGTGIPLVLIGDRNVNPDYYSRCKQVADQSTHFLGPFSHSDPLLRAAYAAARVLAMPSTFESPGLVALEAAVNGCRLAVTNRGNTRDYFGDLVEYVNPMSEIGIRNGVLRAINIPDDKVCALKSRIESQFTWEVIGKQLLSVYKAVLEG